MPLNVKQPDDQKDIMYNRRRGTSALRCLVTCCGAAPALSTVEALRKQKKYKICVITCDNRKDSIGKFVGDEFEVVPGFLDKNFCGYMIQLCKRKKQTHIQKQETKGNLIHRKKLLIQN